MKNVFKFICCGSVDDGKSTLIGRLLLDSGNVKKDQYEDALKASRKNGSDKIELAMLLDGLLAEREQQITIDIAHRYFDYQDIRFHILDCPGHKQYTQNMAIAAAEADSAIVVIDCVRGIQDQTRRHIEICDRFQIKNICVCLTKCDLIENEKGQIDTHVLDQQISAVHDLLKQYTFNYQIIPVSAVTGYNVDKVLQTLLLYEEENRFKKEKTTTSIIHIQTSKMHHEKRYYYGRSVTSAAIKKNAGYRVYPQQSDITISDDCLTPGCFSINEQVDIQSGDCLSNYPVIVSNQIKHHTVWFKEHDGSPLLLKHGTRIVEVVRFSENEIELDNNLIFNNIEDVKENGFGILIDARTKTTVGCCLFIGNKYASILKEPEIVLKKEQNILVLNESEIKTHVFSHLPDDSKTALERLADIIRKQGVNVSVNHN